MPNTIFTVENQNLDILGEADAVEFFAQLLWAEATADGIGKNLINVPSAITVRDGGIDAEVHETEAPSTQGIIKQGLTRYQIKTGRFSLSGDSDIRALLLRANRNELKPRIKTCLDQGGTLVAVLFGSDNPEQCDGQVKGRMLDILRGIDESYANASIEIWRQNTIRSFLTRFPSLSLSVNRRADANFQSHLSWSRQADMDTVLKEGDSQREVIQGLRSILRDASSAVHLRIWGEPGIGKTRLALEATNTEDLAPLVLYCDAASKFSDSFLMNELMRDDNSFNAVLVVDECDPDSRARIWNRFRSISDRIKLITLYTEDDSALGDTSFIQAPILENDQVMGIIQEYGVPQDQAQRWVEYCDGSPRVAHVIGENLRSNPEDLLGSPDTVNVWQLYIQGSDPSDSESVRLRTVVLRHLALFKRFGFATPVVEEAQAIASLIQGVEPSITWGRFQDIVQELRRRRILQGETTLYITPRLLHIRLWRDWWETYGTGFNYPDFESKLTLKLLDWFKEMFRYAGQSPALSGIVENLLGPSSPFANENFLQSEKGASFFVKLSEGDPYSALEYLRRTVGNWNKQQLLEFTTGRRQVVWSLKGIVVWKDFFDDAAALLLQLGETENEHRISNNASGEFTKLFAVGTGVVASTEASGEQRLQVLRRAVESTSNDRQRLAIRACGVALESRYWVREVGPENQGLRRSADLWRPNTYGDIWNYYRQVWEMLLAALDEFDDTNRAYAVDILLEHTRALTTIETLSETVMNGIRHLLNRSYVNDKRILSIAIDVISYEREHLSPDALAVWERFRDELTGTDFSSLMKRYVGMDLLEDQYDEHGNRSDALSVQLSTLAQRAADDTELLRPELNWLVTEEAQNGFRFGYELGMRDTTVRLLPDILEAQRNSGTAGSFFFLGGYFRAIRETGPEDFETLFDGMMHSNEMREWIPELTFRSGPLSDKAASRILDLLESRAIDTGNLRMFGIGGLLSELSETVFTRWIKLLLDTSEYEALVTALELFSAYYCSSTQERHLPRELTLRLLINDILYEPRKVSNLNRIARFWTIIGEVFMKEYLEDAVVVGEKMIEHLGERGTVVEGSHSQAYTILNKITRRRPENIWPMVSRVLGPPIDARAYRVGLWLRGEGLFNSGGFSAIELFPQHCIWDWVNEDVEIRAPYLATLVPPRLSTGELSNSLTRELLIRFGHSQDVRRRLQGNFSTEGSTGPYSVHLQQKKDKLMKIREDEEDRNVLLWLEEYTNYINQQIKQARMEEERSSFFAR